MGARSGILGLGLPPLHLGAPFRPKVGSPASRGVGQPILGLGSRPATRANDPSYFGFSEEQIEEGRQELSLLKRVFGSFARAGNETFSYMAGRPEEQRVVGYLHDRTFFFGLGAYQRQLAEARGQLEADGGKLRKIVEPPLKRRDAIHDWKKGQDVFYAWVRRGYERSGISPKDVPDLISSGITKKLRETLKAVGASYGKARYAKLKIGGFNARPIKHTGHYVLGTLSDHAYGNAVDIDPKQNAQISSDVWRSILKLTHTSLNKTTRETLWSDDPQKLHTTIMAINGAFVRNLQDAIAKVRAEAKTEAGGSSDKLKAMAALSDDAALTAAIAASPTLQEFPRGWVKEHRDGFFNLPWSLVKALRDEECVWGAVFETVDLHHFQLPPPLPAPVPGRVNLLLTRRRPDSERAT